MESGEDLRGVRVEPPKKFCRTFWGGGLVRGVLVHDNALYKLTFYLLLLTYLVTSCGGSNPLTPRQIQPCIHDTRLPSSIPAQEALQVTVNMLLRAISGLKSEAETRSTSTYSRGGSRVSAAAWRSACSCLPKLTSFPP